MLVNNKLTDIPTGKIDQRPAQTQLIWTFIGERSFRDWSLWLFLLLLLFSQTTVNRYKKPVRKWAHQVGTISNLNQLLNKSLEKWTKLSLIWVFSDLENRRRIQKALFPDDLLRFSEFIFAPACQNAQVICIGRYANFPKRSETVCPEGRQDLAIQDQSTERMPGKAGAS
jgi:hypothetical protein